jgi:hypothetical protein
MDSKDAEHMGSDEAEQAKEVQAADGSDLGCLRNLSKTPDCRDHCMHCGLHCIYLKTKREDSE